MIVCCTYACSCLLSNPRFFSCLFRVRLVRWRGGHSIGKMSCAQQVSQEIWVSVEIYALPTGLCWYLVSILSLNILVASPLISLLVFQSHSSCSWQYFWFETPVIQSFLVKENNILESEHLRWKTFRWLIFDALFSEVTQRSLLFQCVEYEREDSPRASPKYPLITFGARSSLAKTAKTYSCPGNRFWSLLKLVQHTWP